MTLESKIKLWHNFVKNDYQLKKSLIIDKKMCRILLSNKSIFGTIRDYSPKWTREYGTHFKTTVSRKRVRVAFVRSYGDRKLYSTVHCFGDRGNTAPGFAFEVSKMTHLSQFLATYAAWLAKKNK